MDVRIESIISHSLSFGNLLPIQKIFKVCGSMCVHEVVEHRKLRHPYTVFKFLNTQEIQRKKLKIKRRTLFSIDRTIAALLKSEQRLLSCIRRDRLHFGDATAFPVWGVRFVLNVVALGPRTEKNLINVTRAIREAVSSDQENGFAEISSY